MQELIRLAKEAEDERVKSVCLVSVLDRAGVKPIDKPEYEPERDDFDPEKYTEAELDAAAASECRNRLLSTVASWIILFRKPWA
jgi:hypothetical protein